MAQSNTHTIRNVKRAMGYQPPPLRINYPVTEQIKQTNNGVTYRTSMLIPSPPRDCDIIEFIQRHHRAKSDDQN